MNPKMNISNSRKEQKVSKKYAQDIIRSSNFTETVFPKTLQSYQTQPLHIA